MCGFGLWTNGQVWRMDLCDQIMKHVVDFHVVFNYRTTLSKELRATPVILWDESRCDTVLDGVFNNETMVCGKSHAEGSICGGDSGGWS